MSPLASAAPALSCRPRLGTSQRTVRAPACRAIRTAESESEASATMISSIPRSAVTARRHCSSAASSFQHGMITLIRISPCRHSAEEENPPKCGCKCEDHASDDPPRLAPPRRVLLRDVFPAVRTLLGILRNFVSAVRTRVRARLLVGAVHVRFVGVFVDKAHELPLLYRCRQ